MVSLSSPSDSEASDYEVELDQFRKNLEKRFQDPGLTPDSSECMSDTQPSSAGNAQLYYKQYRVEVPQGLADSSLVFSKDAFEGLPEEEHKRLLELLPGGNNEEKEEILEKMWDPDSTYFRSMHPVKLFQSLFNAHYFSEAEHKARKTESKIYWLELAQYLSDTQSHLTKWKDFANSLEHGQQTEKKSDHYFKLEEIWKEEVPSDPESVRDLNPAIFCQEGSSSEEDEIEPEFKASEMSDSFEEVKIKGSSKKEKKEAKPKVRDELDELMSSDRFQELKMHKNQLTIKPRSKEWIYWYRRQEFERYSNPTRPWVYYNEDGTMSIVAPVCKKAPTSVFFFK